MPDLKLDELRDAREGQAGSGLAGPWSASTAGSVGSGSTAGPSSSWGRRAMAIAGPAALWRDHRLFTILAAISLLPRMLALLAFRPALLTADSFLYMQDAVKGTLGQLRPSGYSWFLRILQVVPHPLLAVTVVQHLMGIAIAAIVYGLLRYWGLPAWGACLAAAPTLFDTREIALESYILPDTLYCLVIMVAVALLITKRTPRLWQCALAGLLLAYVTVLRGNGLPVAVVAAAYLLIRRVGWRAFCTAAVAFGLPVIGYALSFHATYGEFNITSSDGVFLWSRTTSFANCAIIKPPADLLALCPNQSLKAPAKTPAWSTQALLNRPTPADYLWASNAWWRHDAHPGINAYNNKRGMQFALDAIKAQPLAYLRSSASDVTRQFLASDRPLTTGAMAFTPTPRFGTIPSYYILDIKEYANTTSNTHAVEPYAYFLYLYQLPVYLPGIVFFGVLVAGFAGILRKRRQWGGPAALPWAIAVLSMLLPALLTQSFYRYTLVAIPLGCIAAGLAFVRSRPHSAPATAGPLLTTTAMGAFTAGPGGFTAGPAFATAGPALAAQVRAAQPQAGPVQAAQSQAAQVPPVQAVPAGQAPAPAESAPPDLAQEPPASFDPPAPQPGPPPDSAQEPPASFDPPAPQPSPGPGQPRMATSPDPEPPGFAAPPGSAAPAGSAPPTEPSIDA